MTDSSSSSAAETAVSTFGYFNPYTQSHHPNSSSQVYFTLDFETNAASDWFAAAVLVAEYPSGRVLEHFTTSTRVHWNQFSPGNLQFWNKRREIVAHLNAQSDQTAFSLVTHCESAHRDFMSRIGDRASDSSSGGKRLALALYIRHVHDTYQHARPIGDNLALDMRLIDCLLGEFGLPEISLNRSGSFVQPICISSHRACLLGMGGAFRDDTVEAFHHHVFSAFYCSHCRRAPPPASSSSVDHQPEMTTEMLSGGDIAAPPSSSPCECQRSELRTLRSCVSSVARPPQALIHPRHTFRKHVPIVDCANTMLSYFQALDLVKFYRRFRLRPQNLSSLHMQSAFNVRPHISIQNDMTNADCDDDDAPAVVARSPLVASSSEFMPSREQHGEPPPCGRDYDVVKGTPPPSAAVLDAAPSAASSPAPATVSEMSAANARPAPPVHQRPPLSLPPDWLSTSISSAPRVMTGVHASSMFAQPPRPPNPRDNCTRPTVSSLGGQMMSKPYVSAAHVSPIAAPPSHSPIVSRSPAARRTPASSRAVATAALITRPERKSPTILTAPPKSPTVAASAASSCSGSARVIHKYEPSKMYEHFKRRTPLFGDHVNARRRPLAASLRHEPQQSLCIQGRERRDLWSASAAGNSDTISGALRKAAGKSAKSKMESSESTAAASVPSSAASVVPLRKCSPHNDSNPFRVLSPSSDDSPVE